MFKTKNSASKSQQRTTRKKKKDPALATGLVQNFRPSTDGFLGDLAGRKGGYHVGTVASS